MISPVTRNYWRSIYHLFTLLVMAGLTLQCSTREQFAPPLAYVSTIAGTNHEFGESFGVATKGSEVYVSDGENGVVWVLAGGQVRKFADGLGTPSGLAFTKAGDLLIADAGTNSIKSVSPAGELKTIAGVDGKSGFADGNATTALFNAPIGIAATEDGRVFVADTYNDRIRVIENGKVSTLAGGQTGFADGVGADAMFDTPCGLAVVEDKVIVADSRNRRIRVVEPDGRVWTLAGSGEDGLRNGPLLSASFVEPIAITQGPAGSFLVADGNAIREVGGLVPFVRTISGQRRGLADGEVKSSRFDRPSGLAFDTSGALIVADSDNRLVRKVSAAAGTAITADQIAGLREKPEEFRQEQPARWPFDPPTAKREVAGTLGELRGEIKPGDSDVHFHNGLDVAGGYGETARFVRAEKVLLPSATDNFGTLRELLRMPTMGYIHIRLGRDQTSRAFGDPRFQFIRDESGKLTDVRVPRGSEFKAGEPIGTLNPMNHVHLIAGRSGQEMNAIDALVLPGLSDSRPPVIETVALFDQGWHPLETEKGGKRIRITGKTRIVVRAYDQADGSAARRRLGLYKLGYSISTAGNPVPEPAWTIVFDRMPEQGAVELVYGPGSKSGATGETIFNYIVSNSVKADNAQESFLDPTQLPAGEYTLRVFAADYFGNIAHQDLTIEVLK